MYGATDTEISGWVRGGCSSNRTRHDQRGRRDPNHLNAGEAVDFWRVEECDRGHLLRLRAEMKLPELAWLELSESRRVLPVVRALMSDVFAKIATYPILQPIHIKGV